MNIAIIGLGLMGGSAAIDLKKRGFADKIIGVDNNRLHAETALHIGVVDEIASMEEAIANCDLVVVAVPVDSAVKLIPKILDQVNGQAITDMCSTKEMICQLVKYHPKRKNYVAAHPMAGTEFSGPWAAKSGLFDGKAVMFCDAEESDIRALAVIRRMFEALNMRVTFMDASSHDRHAAFVSHISHISSFALALTVLDQERNEKHIFDMASGGFDSTVRLAKSSAEMWSPIFEQNAENVVVVLNTYIQKLSDFKEAIEDGDRDKIDGLIKKSNQIKKILK
ncbi:MAG: prephenate dehydrogenase [Bacteroidales bacterium]|nr:prephenate dehydrogenase [Bacteroidales bacterium]